MAERAEPMACEFPDHRGGDDDRTPFITVFYPHPLTYAELELLRFKLSELQRECEGAGVEASSTSASPLMWEARLTDLVFIIDALKACGYLTATDASILANVSFRSESNDRAKVYRGTRKKLKDGDSYPDNKRLELLIEELRKGLDAKRR